MAFTVKDVQTLRERTGCGMMDCKNALAASDGDMDKAIEFLREKGLAAAAKKATRIAAEGVVAAVVDEVGKVAAIVEVNSETDFVAKNESFQEFVDTVARTVIACDPADVDALLQCRAAGSDETVDALLKDKILTIGENLKIRRFERIEGTVATYIHGGGRIGVAVKFSVSNGAESNEAFKEAAKDVAMQVAAATPLFLDKDSVPAEELEQEKKILLAQALQEGKPQNIAEKMVMGRVAKYYKENCLVEQAFIKDNEVSVAQFLKKVAADIGADIKVEGFVRYEKGEGLQKREDNFADEVAKMVQ